MPNATTPPDATVFVSGVPGANGIAFDRDGNLWTGDDTTGRGRVWQIGSSGGVCEPSFTGCEEVFRVQPMCNGTDLGGNVSAQSGITSQGVARRAVPSPPRSSKFFSGAITASANVIILSMARGTFLIFHR